jgi:hypothetical protein
LVSASKSELLDRVLNGDTSYPAARVNPIAGELTWIVGL